mmetsp:Transcript_26294/g.53629  ORF Transcript_26294/g.53629 Transcript_26294/m.53629 type:complete len:403 (-) Transcript_26294:82-1290(-)|eukprot:CAMPEP_0181316728 /NCGR_PEP_ID=MMETSP1101-20121128/16052_1 /TAXON_ID=46948 /ORGANISM="Rhodomonas abbreviata, Strain Caron Lab Isolate" /LENGTH=402 /DNA_ID=CAMNT_0023423999 /DNA_START=210 /DNA_END=1418 /DNA_ORIENTATION=-
MELADGLTEDGKTGALRLSKPREKRDATSAGIEESSIRRGVIRFLVVIIDSSAVMNQRDMRPTRLAVVEQVVSSLIDNYFDQNPISQLALVDLRDGRAEKITELSGNARHHKARLEERMAAKRNMGGGVPSMRAGLELAASMLEIQASYGTREVLLVYGSLSTCDRGDIFQTAGRLQTLGVRVNVVGIAAELYVAKAISSETGGTYTVATQAMMLRDMVLSHIAPPPVLEEVAEGRARKKPAAGMWVGFPTRREGSLPGWQCPRCHSLASSVPSDCGICSLKLLSSSHLARSYHHLFPVPSFRELPPSTQDQDDDEEGEGEDPASAPASREGGECRGCGVWVSAEEEAAECVRCAGLFCWACDSFIHEMLHVCPGCQARLLTPAAAPAAAAAAGGGDAEDQA